MKILRRPARREGGYSLLEILIALAAFTPMAIGLFAVFFGAMKIWVKEPTRFDSIQNNRAAIDVILQHLRPAIFFGDTIPVDDGDVGTGKGRNNFQLLGQDAAVFSNDALGWYGVIYHTEEQNASGGDVQYAMTGLADYTTNQPAGTKRVIAFTTGEATYSGGQKSGDADPFPKSTLPPATWPTTTTAGSRLFDDAVYFDIEYTDDTFPKNWVSSWDAKAKGRLPKFVRITVRVEPENLGDSIATSVIVHLPLARAGSSIWPGNRRP